MSFPCKHFTALSTHFTMLFAVVSGDQLLPQQQCVLIKYFHLLEK